MMKRFCAILLVIGLALLLFACNTDANQALQEYATPNNQMNPIPVRNETRWQNKDDEQVPVAREDDNISATKTTLSSDKYPHTRAILIQEAKFKEIPYNQAGDEKANQENQAGNHKGERVTKRNTNPQDLPNVRKEVREGIRQRISRGEWWPNVKRRQDRNQQAIPDQNPPANQQPDENIKQEEKAGTPPPPDEKQAQETRISEFAQRVIDLTNEHREANGLKPLTHDPELSRVAQQKSVDMHQNNYFSHTSPTYGSPFDMMRDSGIEYKTAGENIAQGQRTPEAVVEAWMNSSGHRANILNPDFTHIGVGVEKDEYHWTQMFIGK